MVERDNQKWNAHPCPRLIVENSKRRDLQKESLLQWQSALKWGLGEVQPGSTPSGHTAELPCSHSWLSACLRRSVSGSGCDPTVPICFLKQIFIPSMLGKMVCSCSTKSLGMKTWSHRCYIHPQHGQASIQDSFLSGAQQLTGHLQTHIN